MRRGVTSKTRNNLCCCSISGSGQAYQRYWPGPPANVWNWQMDGGGYPTHGGYPTTHGQMPSGPVWHSPWVPIRDFNQLNFNPGSLYPTPGGGFTSNAEAEAYVRQFYPQLFNPPPRHDPMVDIYPWGNPGHGQSVPWEQPNPHMQHQGGGGVGGQQWYQESPQPIQEVIATCDRQYCYRSCRLGLLGGGRCTKAGCMCYHSYFDHDGKPLVYRFQEDYIWHSLKEDQQRAIVAAMRAGVPRRPPPTQPPKLPKLPTSSSPSGGKARGTHTVEVPDDFTFVDPRNPDRPSPMFGGGSEDAWGQEEPDIWGAEEEAKEKKADKPRGPTAPSGGGWWAEPDPDQSAAALAASSESDGSGDADDEGDEAFEFGDDTDFFG